MLEDGQEKVPSNFKKLKMYGHCVVYRLPRTTQWIVDACDEYLNLPAHYMYLPEAFDRVAFLKSKDIDARVASLLVLPSDTSEEFEQNKIGPDNLDWVDEDGRFAPENRDPEDLAEGGK